MKREDSKVFAIVGRPNVGKSTLFNKLTRRNIALVSDVPGLTRDRIYGRMSYEHDDEDLGKLILVDTGGYETKDHYFQPFKENIVWQQSMVAIEQADVVLFMVDATVGRSPHDDEIWQYLQSLKKRLILVINKVDGEEQKSRVWDFLVWGIQDCVDVSAAHGRKISELREKIWQVWESIGGKLETEGKDSSLVTNVAIIGRPNVGKSSLLNRLVAEERSLVSEVAGTTRDVVDAEIRYHGRTYKIIDTAGIRRRTRVHEKIDAVSMIRAMQMIQQADVVLLVIDAVTGFVDQDARLARFAAEAFKPLVVVVNKWDLHANKTTNSTKEWREEVLHSIQAITIFEVIFVSCLENQRVHKIMSLVEKAQSTYMQRRETSKVNEALTSMVKNHTPTLDKKHNKRIKFYYATQVDVSPPHIIVFSNVAKEIHESYKRYMHTSFKEFLGFQGIPIKLSFKAKAEQRQLS